MKLIVVGLAIAIGAIAAFLIIDALLQYSKGERLAEQEPTPTEQAGLTGQSGQTGQTGQSGTTETAGRMPHIPRARRRSTATTSASERAADRSGVRESDAETRQEQDAGRHRRG